MRSMHMPAVDLPNTHMFMHHDIQIAKLFRLWLLNDKALARGVRLNCAMTLCVMLSNIVCIQFV